MRHATPLLGLPLVLGLFTAAAVGGESADAATWDLPDPSGDVYFHDKDTGVPLPSSVLNSHMDLTGVEISGEDEAGLYVTFHLVDLEISAFALYYGQAEDRLSLDFQFAGAPVEYSLYVQVVNGFDPVRGKGATWPHGAYLCIRQPSGNCFLQPIHDEFDPAENTVRLHLTKAALTGRGGMGYSFSCGIFGCDHPEPLKRPPPGTPDRIRPGDRLTNLHAYYRSTDPETSTSFHDEAPNQGEAAPYLFQRLMANLVVSAEVSPYAGRSVEVGETTHVEIPISNKATVKRIVNLTYGLQGPAGNASQFHVRGPESLTVPAQETRNVTVAVTAAAAALNVRDVALVLRGHSVGFPDELVYGRVFLRPTLSPSPEQPRLFFHSRQDEQRSPLPVDPVGCQLGGCTYAWLNSLEQDPLDQNVEVAAWITMNELGTFEQEFWIGSTTGSARPLAFGEEPVQLALSLKSAVPVEGELSVELSSSGGLVASGRQDVSLSGTAAPVVFSMTAASADLVLQPEESRFDLAMRFVAQPVAYPALPPVAVHLLPRESGLRLPLVDLPEAFERGTPNSPLRLTPQGPPDEYVNPGEGRLFNVSLAFTGADADVAHLSASIDQPGWTVHLLPGADYRVEPGNTVVFGVLAVAPAQAKEGETATIRINATTDLAPEERAFLRLGLIATNGYDLPDQSDSFQAEGDAEKKLVLGPDTRKSPGPALLGLLAAGAVALAYRRRRKA